MRQPDSDALHRFVDDVGMAMEGVGLPRAAGRALAWLLVCEPPEQAAADLVEALGSSTGGVSQSMKMLMQLSLVERTARRGDRRSYYRVAPGAWERVIAAQQADTVRLRELGEKGLEVLASSPDHRRSRLQEMTDFFAFLEREMPALVRRWAETKGTSHD